ncbi:MAG: hypothetical protein ACT4OU_11330 [Hyphomicrobium sp.]
MSEHAVIVRFVDYGQRFFAAEGGELTALYDLEGQLEETLEATGAGMFDGDEIAVDGSDGYLYMYGPDAQTLFESVARVLAASPVTRGGEATLRFGDVGDSDAREVIVQL